MKEKIIKLFKRFIFAGLILYTYNKFGIYFNGVIPINYFSICFVSLFGVPAIVGLLIFRMFIF